MKKIIAFSGWKGSGKDTLAQYMIDRYFTERFAFADELKNAVASEFGVERHHMDDVTKKDQPIFTMPVDAQDDFSKHVVGFMKNEFKENNGRLYWTPRALCILKGSTCRTVDPNHWVNKVVEKIALSHANFCVITDLRYWSEMVRLKEEFGDDISFIRVERFDSSPSTDPSERDLDGAPFDLHVDNRTSKENAFKQLEEFLNKLFEEYENE